MSKRVHIGHLDRRIVLQSPESTRSNTGQEVLEWNDVATVWAAVDYARTGSREQVEGDQLVASNSVVFIIRYRTGLNEKMRLLYQSEPYNITIIRELPNKYLELTTLKQQ